MISSTTNASDSYYLRPAQALTAPVCLMKPETLLEHEFERDREVSRSPKDWERIRAAALEGRVDDIPIASETLDAWGFTEVPGEEGLRECADLLPDALHAVELVWDDSRDVEVPQEALGAALYVAAARRERLLAEYRVPAREVPSVWYEVHQGCARRDAQRRVRILRRIGQAITHSSDPCAIARVELAHATEFEAKGEYQNARESLDAAVRMTWHFRNPERREPAPIALAQWLWRCGEVESAKRLLSQLRSEHACEVARRIDEKAEERRTLASADQIHGERASFESLRALTLAHLSAGHGVAAEYTARNLCAEHPEHALAWETKARVLYATARYRSALDPAVKWTDLAPDSASARSLLARVFARLGQFGREPAGSIAAAAIEICERGQDLPTDEVEELAEICHRAEFFDWARRGDDLVWTSRAQREPSAEWLGAAVARRCHGVWAGDAPEWIARLSDADPHALAKWATERVESLQHWCDRIHGHQHAPAAWRRVEPVMTPNARAIHREADHVSTRLDARRAAHCGARGLGYSEEKAMDAVGEMLRPVDDEDEPNPDSVSHWSAHLAPHRSRVRPGDRHRAARKRDRPAGLGGASRRSP